MAAPTTRPLGLGFGIVSQACACYDTGNANWSTAPTFVASARDTLNASWVHNWHHSLQGCAVGQTWPSPSTHSWYYTSIDNILAAQAGDPASWRWDLLVDEALDSRRFTLLWNEPNLNGMATGAQVAQGLIDWRNATKKLVNNVWTYTKFAAPGVYIDGVTYNSGTNPYGLRGTNGVGEYLVAMMDNLNSAQMPDTWNIHIYADSVTEFEAIWEEWKDWMSDNDAEYDSLRPTIIGELNIPGAGAGTQEELMESVANLLTNDSTYFKAAAWYALGSEYLDGGDDTEELYVHTLASGSCPGCMIASGKFSPTTILTATGEAFQTVASGLGQS